MPNSYIYTAKMNGSIYVLQTFANILRVMFRVLYIRLSSFYSFYCFVDTPSGALSYLFLAWSSKIPLNGAIGTMCVRA